MDKKALLRKIPSVEEILVQNEIKQLLSLYPRGLVLNIIRNFLESLREKILNSTDSELNKIEVELPSLVKSLSILIKVEALPSLKRVINATGVILHTNLGRAPLSEKAKKQVLEVMEGYCNLELDLKTGKRGSRYFHIEGLLREITGAEDGFVVNNNAAAVFLALSTFAKGKEVIVSRSELIEIGGSFRLPEIMKLSGAKLVEVGTTNKTYLKDYQLAISEETALILKVHPSNFRIIGFTNEATLSELVELGREFQLPVMYDAGSGALVDFAARGFPGEPTIQQAVKMGAQIVTFSGDKLLGGTQAGMIVGKKEALEKMKKNHLTRALRVDKLTLAALEATLRHYFEEDVWKSVPVLKMLSMDLGEIKERAKNLASKMRKVVGAKGEVSLMESFSETGGGALPNVKIPTWVVTLKINKLSSLKISELLRQSNPPIIVRIEEDKVVFDLRTLLPGEERTILGAISHLVV